MRRIFNKTISLTAMFVLALTLVTMPVAMAQDNSATTAQASSTDGTTVAWVGGAGAAGAGAGAATTGSITTGSIIAGAVVCATAVTWVIGAANADSSNNSTSTH